MKEVLKKNQLYICVTIVILLIITILVYKPKLISAEEKLVDNHLFDKIIIIGDSRMELIENKKDYYQEIPSNMLFIARSGREVNWFNEYATERLFQELRNSNERVAVVINMGVNDIQFHSNLNNAIDRYITSFNNLSYLYPNINFYVLSVNPLNEDIIQENFESNIRTNEKIEKMNSSFQAFINQSNFENLKYCDAYNEIHFNTRDGLHYTANTNEKIIEYILNDCLKK